MLPIIKCKTSKLSRPAPPLILLVCFLHLPGRWGYSIICSCLVSLSDKAVVFRSRIRARLSSVLQGVTGNVFPAEMTLDNVESVKCPVAVL